VEWRPSLQRPPLGGHPAQDHAHHRTTDVPLAGTAEVCVVDVGPKRVRMQVPLVRRVDLEQRAHERPETIRPAHSIAMALRAVHAQPRRQHRAVPKCLRPLAAARLRQRFSERSEYWRSTAGVTAPTAGATTDTASAVAAYKSGPFSQDGALRHLGRMRTKRPVFSCSRRRVGDRKRHEFGTPRLETAQLWKPEGQKAQSSERL
jgi:hypothetical protein